MPSYFEMLKMADPAVMQEEWLNLLRGGGLIVGIAAFVLLLAFFWFVVGLFGWRRSRVQQAALFAIIGMVVGWVGSYLGYSKAAELAGAANAAPKAEELASAANHIAFAGFAPTVLAVGLVILCGLVSLVVRDKKKGAEPEPA